jgi:prokaryotic ubiquitin-like protein Pup
MATRDTGGQSQSGRSRRETEDDQSAAPEVDPEVTERVEKVSEEVDDLLDEIDSVLEENAEEFIRGYIQKGGQ